MPTSTETQQGFSLSKWEFKYLRRRFRAHRNKVSAASPAIDCSRPAERPHVQIKFKKALTEDIRQMNVLKENLRIINKTASLMSRDVYYSQNKSTLPQPKSALKKKKKSNHILLHWFLIKFGTYLPWWAEVSY